jgi:4-hydroxyphenylacetate 3-monooxygenase
MSHTHTHTSSAASPGNQRANGPISQPENATPPRVLREPPTGKQFLESLQDGRVIYFDGKLVKDVTTHPAFATSARSYARMYDTLHDPAKRDLLTFVTERGARSHKFYKLPRTQQDLFEARDAIAEWARLS